MFLVLGIIGNVCIHDVLPEAEAKQFYLELRQVFGPFVTLEVYEIRRII